MRSDGKQSVIRNYMRHIKFILPILTFSLHAFGQTNIQIVLKTTGGHKIDKVAAFDISKKEIYDYKYQDTLILKFNKKNIDLYNIQYHANGKMFRKQIWLDTGNIKIEARINDENLIFDTVFNSPIYYRAQEFITSFSTILQTNDTININRFLFTAYEENINNPFSYLIGQNYLMINQNSKLDLINFKALIDRQGDGFKWFSLYPPVVERINNILSTSKIKISGFSFFDKHNKKSKLNLTQADYYILDFWFLGCAPCIREHKDILPKLKKLKEKNIEVIGISIDKPDKFNSWQVYLAKNKYLWQNYMQDENNSLTDHLSISTYPTYVILNKEGEIVGSYNMFSDISKKYGLAQ